MTRTYWEEFYREERDGFEIVFSAAPEEDDPSGHFSNLKDVKNIRNGLYAWFMVRVEAFRPDLSDEALGSDYLGGCAYTSASAFVERDEAGELTGYAADMVNASIDEAKAALRRGLPY